MKKNVPTIVVLVDGGIVQQVLSNSNKVNVIVVDTDDHSEEQEICSEVDVEVVSKLSDQFGNETPLTLDFLKENNL